MHILSTRVYFFDFKSIVSMDLRHLKGENPVL